MSSQNNIPEPAFKLGGRHSVARTWRVQPENYRLVGSECNSCGKPTFPRTPLVCPFCGSRDVKDKELGLVIFGEVKGISEGPVRVFRKIRTKKNLFEHRLFPPHFFIFKGLVPIR